MKLREQFKTEFSINTSDESGRFADKCEKIADNYAIEFAEYIYARPNIFNNGSSIKQVLSLFKIEKNL